MALWLAPGHSVLWAGLCCRQCWGWGGWPGAQVALGRRTRQPGGPWPCLTCSPTAQRHSLVRDKCFLSATECLQKVM